MLKVYIELWPQGNPEHKRVLTTFDIANDGTGTVEFGNYKARYRGREWIEDVVKGWNRKRSVLELVYEVLKKKYDGV